MSDEGSGKESGKRLRGMGSVFLPSYLEPSGERKTSNIWVIRYSHRGKRYEESSRSTNRADAVRLLKKRLTEMGSGRFLGPDVEKTTVKELTEILITDYKINGLRSLVRIEDAINHLLEFFDGQRAIDVTGDKIARYVQGRQEELAANGTINRELGALKRAFTLGFRAGKVAQRPYIPMLKEAQARQGFFTDLDILALLAELPSDLRPLIECAYLTGWRIDDELLPLKWSHVDLVAGTIRLDTSKNGEARVYPFSVRPRLETLLRQQREATSALEREQGRIIPYVFHRKGEPIKNFTRAWEAACERIGLPDRIRHDLRRSAIRNMEHAGVPRSVAMRLVGHKTESVYTRYAVMFEDDLKRGVEKLAALDESHMGERSGTVVPLKKGGDTVGIAVAVSRQQGGGGS